MKYNYVYVMYICAYVFVYYAYVCLCMVLKIDKYVYLLVTSSLRIDYIICCITKAGFISDFIFN